jgi:hypothetical protein
MPTLRTRMMPLSLLVAGVLTVSGCQALANLGLGGDDEAVPEETSMTDSDATTAEGNDPGAGLEKPTGFVLPTCDTLYSAEQNAALLEQVRVSVGDNSEGNFGWGTTNLELVPFLQNVRSDLKLSCTWYLPASESVSVTSVAIIDSEVEASVARVLNASSAVRQSAGGGTLWSIAETTSDESPDFIATEAHFMAPVPCPASLAETTCVGWFTTNYSFGQAETLTVDAARNLGVYAD